MPTTQPISPAATAARRAVRSRPLRAEVSRVTGTPSGSSRRENVIMCCSARISVGAITAAW